LYGVKLTTDAGAILHNHIGDYNTEADRYESLGQQDSAQRLQPKTVQDTQRRVRKAIAAHLWRRTTIVVRYR
jgi:hypothetical protein